MEAESLFNDSTAADAKDVEEDSWLGAKAVNSEF